MAEKQRKKLDTTRLLADVVDERIEELNKRHQFPEKYMPVPTPFKDLNRIIHGGLPKFDAFYAVIMGMDKKGKSTLGTQMFMAYCELSGKKGSLYYLEENIWQAADRAMTMRSPSFSRTDIYRIRDLTEEHFEMMRMIAQDIRADVEVYVNDQEYTLEAMIDDTLVRGCQVMGIDNYQLLIGGKGENPVARLEYNSKMIMRARNQYGLTTFLMAQGNEREKTFGSTQPFRDGDFVAELDDKYEVIPGKRKKGNPLAGLKQFTLKRCRFAGVGQLDLVFEPQYSRARNVETKEKDDPETFVEFLEEEGIQYNMFEEQEIINGSETDD